MIDHPFLKAPADAVINRLQRDHASSEILRVFFEQSMTSRLPLLDSMRHRTTCRILTRFHENTDGDGFHIVLKIEWQNPYWRRKSQQKINEMCAVTISGKAGILPDWGTKKYCRMRRRQKTSYIKWGITVAPIPFRDETFRSWLDRAATALIQAWIHADVLTPDDCLEKSRTVE